MSYLQLRFKFRKRALCHIEETYGIFIRTPFITFRNITGDAYHSPSDLIS